MNININISCIITIFLSYYHVIIITLFNFYRHESTQLLCVQCCRKLIIALLAAIVLNTLPMVLAVKQSPLQKLLHNIRRQQSRANSPQTNENSEQERSRLRQYYAENRNEILIVSDCLYDYNDL